MYVPQGAACAQVFGFRATLWEEHWGTWKECMERPESEECVREIQELSRVNWAHHVQEEVIKQPGHAMPYPIKVQSSTLPQAAFLVGAGIDADLRAFASWISRVAYLAIECRLPQCGCPR